MTLLLGAAALREVLARHGVRPVRSLGQNFVIDPNTIRKVLEVAAPGPRDVVLEIGPGAGSLTLGLAERAGSVVAIEKDRRLIPVLEETLAGAPNVKVVHGDALEMELGDLGATAMVANLPYNIAATLVIKVLTDIPKIGSLTVMTQREVGERLAADPGSRIYGRTSVLVALFGSARLAAKVSRRAFWPAPNVDSVIVRIARAAAPLCDDVDTFSSVVTACFASRRKTVRNTLAPLVGSTEKAEAMLARAGLDPGARAENLSAEDFAALTTEVGMGSGVG